MAISVFHHPAFVGVCAALAGGSLVAAVAFWAWPFWAELAAKFLRLPAAGKAALITFVAVATAVAQKEEGTDFHAETKCTEEAKLRREHSPEANPQGAQACACRREGVAVLSTHYTDLHGLGAVVLDRIDKIDRIEETETVSAETSDTLSNPVNPVKENLCASAAPREESVTDDDIARGYRLAEVRTNETVSYELPTNGAVVGTWHLTDAYEAVVRVGLGTEVEAQRGGGERTNEVEAQGGDGERADSLSDLQEEQECLSNHSPPQASTSTFSHPSINAQLELFPSGDFIAPSNEVERVYRRVNPDDWDDDGIPNGEDDDPRIAADETQFGPHQPQPTTQVFTIQNDGTATVSKYGHVIERHTNNDVYLDGVLQN